MKDHEIAELVNKLAEVAQKYGHTQSIRDRISKIVVPAIKSAKTQKPTKITT